VPETIQQLQDRIRELTLPGARGKLSARGLARGMIWRDGILPPGAPAFSATLSVDLLDQGYGLLALALRARHLGDRATDVTRALVVAAESIESAVRKGATSDVDRGFHLFVSAAVFHLAQYAARSFCLLRADSPEQFNLSRAEQCVAALLRSQRRRMRHLCIDWLSDERNSDASAARRLANSDDPFNVEDAERTALTATVLRGLGVFDTALGRGDTDVLANARDRFALASQISRERGYVPLWWTSALTLEVMDNIWEHSLHQVLPPDLDANAEERARWRTLRARYISLLLGRKFAEIQLWPSQMEAARRASDPLDDLVVALPTSAGKTRIAELCILRSLAAKKRIIYVTPLRALSAQVERNLGSIFVPLGFTVTALYGASGVAVVDIGTLRSAEIVVSTPEKLDFALRQEPDVLNDVGLIVLDEGHMIGPDPRELRYEVLVQRLLRRTDASQRRLVCLSAVFSEGVAFSDFTRWLRSDEPGGPVVSDWRPMRQRVGVIQWLGDRGRLSLIVNEERPFVPNFISAEPPRARRRNPFPQDDEELILASAKAFLADGQRVLIYCPLRRSVESLGEIFLKLQRQGYVPTYLPDDADITRAVAIGTEWLGDGHVAVRCLRLGVAVHHGAMPRAFLSEIEELISQRKVRLTIASPTLAQGIDLSASVLVFRSIYRGRSVIPPDEYANVVGRAGRAFVDLDGITIYPIFERGNAARGRIIAFTNLQRQARSRQMESGIVLLITQLIELIVRYTEATSEEISEYVLNTSGPWSIDGFLNGRERSVTDDDPTFDPDAHFVGLLAELDTAILGSVDDPAVTVTSIANALDAALRTSFWSRRLERLTPEDSALQRSILTGRAQWIWARSTPEQRMGFFAAGVGFDAGVALLSTIETLTRQIVNAETLLAIGDAAGAASEMAAFAAVVFTIGPFDPGSRPADWPRLLFQWLSGADLPDVLTDVSKDISFLQDGVVYHLVWAVEAVRSQALLLGIEKSETIKGTLALALTYGVPSYPEALLSQAGLHSRRMVSRVVERFPGAFDNIDSLRSWLAGIPDAGIADLWTNEGERAIWRDFVRRTRESSGHWQDTIQSAPVDWFQSNPPEDETGVRVIHDAGADSTYIYDFELNRIGRLRTPIPEVEESEVIAQVTDNGSQVQIRRFSAARVVSRPS
jgi:hypothetical protein